jgi:hypothetical protein
MVKDFADIGVTRADGLYGKISHNLSQCPNFEHAGAPGLSAGLAPRQPTR